MGRSEGTANQTQLLIGGILYYPKCDNLGAAERTRSCKQNPQLPPRTAHH